MTALRTVIVFAMGTLVGGAFVGVAFATGDETGMVETHLPIQIEKCGSSMCTDKKAFPDDIHPSPTRHSGVMFNVLSNMNVNGGGNIQDSGPPVKVRFGTKTYKAKAYLAITIPEAGTYTGKSRWQTLYVPTPGQTARIPSSYHLITCTVPAYPSGSRYPMCM